MKKILSLFFALVAISFSAFSQGAPASGTVINSNGNVVVTITYIDSLAGTSGTMTVTTDMNGAFTAMIPFVQNPAGISLFAYACITNCNGQTVCDQSSWIPGTMMTFELNFCGGLLTDADGDGFDSSVDCDDNNAWAYPGAFEECNNWIDNNCNGIVDEGCNGDSTFVDTDGDGFPAFADCNDNDPYVNPGAIEECNNGIDNNCDGTIDEGCNGDTTAVDYDNDGYNTLVDCDDNNPYVNPGAFEECNNVIDNDCDGMIDEDCGGLDCSANIILLTDSVLNGAGNAYEVWVINATSLSGNTFVWNTGDGNTLTGAFPTYTYSELGTYTLCVYVTNAAGCVDSACVTFSVNPDGSVSPGGALQQTFTLNVSAEGPVGVDEMVIANEMTVYPNPAQDQTTLAWTSQQKENGTYFIYGMNGQLMASSKFQGVIGRNQVQLNTSEWSSGIYQIVMVSENGTQRSAQVVK
jgi:hypothetical protein